MMLNSRLNVLKSLGRITILRPYLFIRAEDHGIYLGIDPTGSLHIGHLYLLLIMKCLYLDGFNITILIGNYTAMIGDPTERQKSRPLLERKTIDLNTKKLENDIKRFFPKFKIVKNRD